MSSFQDKIDEALGRNSENKADGDLTWNHYNKNNTEYYSVSSGTETTFHPLDENAKVITNQLNELKKDPAVVEHSYRGNAEVATVNKTNQNNRKEIPAGQYIYIDEGYSAPARLVPTSFRKDKYISLPSISKSIITDINEFLENEPLYRSVDPEMCYKLGILLYGEPGEGKSSLIRNIVSNNLPQDAITITLNRDNFISHSMQRHIKKTLSHRLKVFIFEELTTHTESSHDAEQLLSFLDGEASLDKCIVFATTNYPELLPGNIVDRASRIDKMYKLCSPEKEERALILAHYLKRPATEEEVALTDKVSTAYLKEIALTSLIKKISIKESSELIESRKVSIKNNFKSDKKFGLGGAVDEE